MSWKNWSYWARGGVIGLILGIFYFIIISFPLLFGSLHKSIYTIIFPLHYLDFIMYIMFNGACIDFNCVFTLITTPISLIIEGLFIGLFYEQIKNRNKNWGMR